MLLTDDLRLQTDFAVFETMVLMGMERWWRSGPSCMDALKAAVLHDQLAGIDTELDRRRSVAMALDGVVGHRSVPRSGDGPVSVYAFCHPERDRIAQELHAGNRDGGVLSRMILNMQR